MALQLLEPQKPPVPLSSPSLRELSEEVQKELDLYRSSKDNAPRAPPIAVTPEPAHYTSRTLPDPIAAVEICPAYPEYMVVGTYALLKADAPGVSVAQVRNGSVSVVPLAATFKPAYPGAAPPVLDEKSLSAAVLDIHFHPSDDALFGVATSDARMTFFRIVKLAKVVARRVEMRLVCLGSVEVAGPNEHGEIPLITSFCWLPGFVTTGRAVRPEVDEYHRVAFAVSISNGGVRCLQAKLPAASAAKHGQKAAVTKLLAVAELEKHTEEAWTVAATTISTTGSNQDDPQKILILSGGDDSALIATLATLEETIEQATLADVPHMAPLSSQEYFDRPDSAVCSPSLLTWTPHHLWTDRKTHTAGVVAALPLSPQFHPNSAVFPILTGSYDEHIRLFLLYTTSPTLKRSLILEKKLGGGVWRLKLMHESILPYASTPTDLTTQNTRYAAVILASCMHGGVRILRLTYVSPQDSTSTSPSPATSQAQTSGWQILILAKFSKGHESMNYGSDFCVERDGQGRSTGAYTIVSTSFYDKALCVWRFTDEEDGMGK